MSRTARFNFLQTRKLSWGKVFEHTDLASTASPSAVTFLAPFTLAAASKTTYDRGNCRRDTVGRHSAPIHGAVKAQAKHRWLSSGLSSWATGFILETASMFALDQPAI